MEIRTPLACASLSPAALWLLQEQPLSVVQKQLLLVKAVLLRLVDL